MKPKNFPAKKLARQQRAQKVNDAAALEAARRIRTKVRRSV